MGQQLSEMVGVAEAADMLGVSQSRVLHYIYDRRLPTVGKQWGRWLLRRRDVERFAQLPRKTGWRKGRPRGPRKAKEAA